MSPLPNRDRLSEYATKGVHLALRQLAQAPEQRAARRLAPHSPPAVNGGSPRVLFLTPRDWTSHVQWEAMMAQALRIRGADVRFITCGGELEICDRVNSHEGPPVPCKSCRKYVHDSIDAHGFVRQTIREGWDVDGVDGVDGSWPEIDGLSLAELKDVVDPDSGLPLGRLAVIPVTWFLMGAQLESDPLAPVTYRRFLRAGRLVARGLAKALDEQQPDTVVMLNGLFFFESIAWELCRRRDIDVVTYERGFVKETLQFRRDEPACRGDISHLWPAWRDVPLTDEETAHITGYIDDRRHGRRTIDKYWKQVHFDPIERRTSGRLVALFSNVTWDSAVIGRGRAFPSVQAWVAAAIEFIAKRPEHELVIRIHPAEVKLSGKQTREPLGAFLAARFPELPPNVRVITADDTQSSYPLMEECDFGMVFTSTTGLELALHDKPVLVAGETHYRGKGFTVDAADPEEFEKEFERLLEDPSSGTPDRELAQRYGYLFFFRSPIATPGAVEHVPGLVRIAVDSLDDLRPGRNADIDRIAGGILGRGDFGPALPEDAVERAGDSLSR